LSVLLDSLRSFLFLSGILMALMSTLQCDGVVRARGWLHQNCVP
jgi:hypothetical protein